MKRIITMLALLIPVCYMQAQEEDYKNIMLKSIQVLDTTTNVSTLNTLASTFAAAYDIKKDWQPLYYECLTYIKLSEAYQSTEKRKVAIDNAAGLLEILPADHDEVQVLRAFYAMNYLGIDRSAWQQYMPIISDALKKAEALNAENPRIYYLRGILKYNMPASMGGGHEEGIKLFNRAMQKYQSYKPANALAPSWGRKEVEKYLANK